MNPRRQPSPARVELSRGAIADSFGDDALEGAALLGANGDIRDPAEGTDFLACWVGDGVRERRPVEGDQLHPNLLKRTDEFIERIDGRQRIDLRAVEQNAATHRL